MRLFVTLLLYLMLFSVASAEELINSTDGRKFLLKDNGEYQEIFYESSSSSKIDMVDLNIDSEKYLNKRIIVNGTIVVPESREVQKTTLYQRSSMVGLSYKVDLEKLNIETYRALMKNCVVTCLVTVTGILLKSNMDYDYIKAETITLK